VSFEPRWTSEAQRTFETLKAQAEQAAATRKKTKKKKSSKQEGLFKQIAKAVQLLLTDPRHPGLQTHEYDSLPHPYDKNGKVFEAYAQNRTPGAYRIFWCYGPQPGQITIIAITPHPRRRAARPGHP
jgi:hypothetical protein